MNWKAFLAMLARDAHVARRNFVALLFQTFLQPLMLSSSSARHGRHGYMPPSYKSQLLRESWPSAWSHRDLGRCHAADC